MKASRYVRYAAFGAVLILAGAACAQTDYMETWVHGNNCYGGGALPSIYGPYNPSTTSSATVTCPIPEAWSYYLPVQPRYIQIAYYNRNTSANAFTCRLYGLDASGNLVWNPGAVAFPAGSLGSGSQVYKLPFSPPTSALEFTATCTVPPNSAGTGNGYSHLAGIALRVGN
jgi:hypothetical protein